MLNPTFIYKSRMEQNTTSFGDQHSLGSVLRSFVKEGDRTWEGQKVANWEDLGSDSLVY